MDGCLCKCLSCGVEEEKGEEITVLLLYKWLRTSSMRLKRP
jgi:hypothetical protein